MNELLDIFSSLAHSPIYNYVIPGMTSYLITDPSEKGCIRMFVNNREQHVHVIPHSHRFDFKACVLKGSVRNTLWKPHFYGDTYAECTLKYKDKPGKYDITYYRSGVLYESSDVDYTENQWYSMDYNQIHSIKFSKGAIVAVAEGPKMTNNTTILLPWVNNKVIDTFKVQDWMYKE